MRATVLSFLMTERSGEQKNSESETVELLRRRQTAAELERQVKEYQRASQRFAVRDAVTSALAGSSPLGEAAPKILRTICETLGWQLGALWTVEAHLDVLRCVEDWCASPASAPEFEAATHRRTFSRSVRMPGRRLSARACVS
jgi:hypothetical protein